MIEVRAVLQTEGYGLWSNVAKSVTVTGLVLGYVSEDAKFGELCVCFNTDTWDVDEDGLIYTDERFMRELRDMLVQMGLCAVDVEYSEQGMQDYNYVSCDVGEQFIASFKQKFADEYASIYDECNG